MARTKQLTRKNQSGPPAPPPPPPPVPPPPATNRNLRSTAAKRGKNFKAKSSGGKQPKNFLVQANAGEFNRSDSDSDSNSNMPLDQLARSHGGKTAPQGSENADPMTDQGALAQRIGPSRSAAATTFRGRGRQSRRKQGPKRIIRAEDLCPVKKV